MTKKPLSLYFLCLQKPANFTRKSQITSTAPPWGENPWLLLSQRPTKTNKQTKALEFSIDVASEDDVGEARQQWNRPVWHLFGPVFFIGWCWHCCAPIGTSERWHCDSLIRQVQSPASGGTIPALTWDRSEVRAEYNSKAAFPQPQAPNVRLLRMLCVY